MRKATGPAGTVGDSLARLERWLEKNRPEFHRALLPGASADDLRALELELGRPLPDGLRILLGWHNGEDSEAVGCFEQSRRLMSSKDIAAASKEQMEAAKGGKSGDHWDPAWIPFLDDDAGNYVCLDASLPEVPLREIILGRSNQQLLADSLDAWLADFLAAVEHGEYAEDPERGTFMRRMPT